MHDSMMSARYRYCLTTIFARSEIIAGALRALWARFEIGTPRGEASDPLSAGFTTPSPHAVSTVAASPQQQSQSQAGVGVGATSAGGVGVGAGAGDEVVLLPHMVDDSATQALGPLVTPPISGTIVYRRPLSPEHVDGSATTQRLSSS